MPCQCGLMNKGRMGCWLVLKCDLGEIFSECEPQPLPEPNERKMVSELGNPGASSKPAE